MAKPKKYSLWLVPERDTEEYIFLENLIRKIAGEYNTPIFNPHVTLLGLLEGNLGDIRNKTKTLAGELIPYEIQLGKVGSNGTYFQILFSAVEQTASVMRAHETAQKIFRLSQGMYFPHLSLAYGDLSKAEVTHLEKRIQQEYPIVNMRFLVQYLELWSTDETVRDWRLIKRFSFGKA